MNNTNNMIFMRKISVLKIVAVPAQALANIRRFEAELKGSSELQARLAYARAWYADKDDKGQWRFGPSKFIGYQDIDAKIYLATAEETDGRRTEAQLQDWFHVVTADDPLQSELNAALVSFLAKYGKTPSTKARISVQRERRRLSFIRGARTDEKNETSNLVNLLVVVARSLPEEQFRQLRDQLEDIWS
jgi:hypothetical protein